MTPTDVAPHVLAAADQFLATGMHGDGAGHAVTAAVHRWMEAQWAAGVDPDFVDRTVRDLACYLAARCVRPTSWQMSTQSASVDPLYALDHRPDLHAFVVPLVVAQRVADDDLAGAHEAWSRLALATLRNEYRRSVRAQTVAQAVSLLVVLSLASRPVVLR